MKMNLPALVAAGLLMFAGAAQALETDGLIAVSAMPLAVADVVALPDVPQNDVMTIVTTLNRAAVPAPQFVEIVRYAPVAIVQQSEPRFATYVTQEYDRGLTGEPLALAIADRYDSYGIDDVRIADPPVVTYVAQQQVLPQVVVTQFQPVQFDPVSVIAMPLAVAAVADLVNVPRTDLMQFVASLNRAMVPAPQFVEVVRYSPVVFVDRTESPRFIRYVTTEVDRGVTGRPLAYAIADRIRTIEPVQIDVRRPRVIVDRDVLPPVVTTRVARAHPHGGPPGQLKKELGLQTGAEVVHGEMPRRAARPRTVIVHRDEHGDRHVIVSEPRPPKKHEQHVAKPRRVHETRVAPPPQRVQPQHIQPQRVEHAPKPQRIERAPKPHGNPHANMGGGGGGQGRGKGKGKGKG